MGKYNIALCAMLAVTAAATPAFAQDAPAAAEKKAPAASGVGGMTKGGGAASASYARSVSGTPTDEKATEASNPPTAEPAEGKGRTYTGGRRNDGQPSTSGATANVQQGASLMGGRDGPLPATLTAAGSGAPTSPGAEAAKIAPVSIMPSRLSMTPTTAKQTAKVAPAPAQPAKGHNEKGIK